MVGFDAHTITAAIPTQDWLDAGIYSGVDLPLGTQITFTAAPAEGHHISTWYVNGSLYASLYGMGTPNSITLTITGDLDVRMTFADSSMAVVTFGQFLNLLGFDGKGIITAAYMDADGELQSFESGSSLPRGTEIIFHAIPAENHSIRSWYVNGMRQWYAELDFVMTLILDKNLDVMVEFFRLNAIGIDPPPIQDFGCTELLPPADDEDSENEEYIPDEEYGSSDKLDEDIDEDTPIVEHNP